VNLPLRRPIVDIYHAGTVYENDALFIKPIPFYLQAHYEINQILYGLFKLLKSI
jgi:hypothetical protein